MFLEGPTPCESERASSAQAGNFFVPSCTDTGAYVPTQCQAGGQCWCVDAEGKEIFGTRQYGVPECSKCGLYYIFLIRFRHGVCVCFEY